MPGMNLTTTSSVQCMHGGKATLTTSNTKVTSDGAPVLLESDIHSVMGCPFTVGTKYSPCVRIEWTAGASNVSVDGTPALVRTSVGKCYSAENATQGVAIVGTTQIKAQSR